MLAVEIFTDGACRGNPGLGGWGALLRYPTHENSIYGAESLTTNNRMELMAAIKALCELHEPCKVLLTTDSEYVKKGITEWLKNWKRRGWMTANKQPVKNKDLWCLLDQKTHDHQVTWRWTRGHSGHPGNERADKLANQALDEWLLKKSKA